MYIFLINKHYDICVLYNPCVFAKIYIYKDTYFKNSIN